MNVNVGVNQAMDARALKIAEPVAHESLTDVIQSIFEASERIGYQTMVIRSRLFGSEIAEDATCKTSLLSLQDVLHEIRSTLTGHADELENINIRIGG